MSVDDLFIDKNRINLGVRRRQKPEQLDITAQGESYSLLCPANQRMLEEREVRIPLLFYPVHGMETMCCFIPYTGQIHHSHCVCMYVCDIGKATEAR